MMMINKQCNFNMWMIVYMSVAYTGIWKGGDTWGSWGLPPRGQGAAPQWGVEGEATWSWKVSSKIVGEIVQYFIVLVNVDYFVRNNMKGKKFFQAARGGDRDPCPPPKYATVFVQIYTYTSCNTRPPDEANRRLWRLHFHVCGVRPISVTLGAYSTSILVPPALWLWPWLWLPRLCNSWCLYAYTYGIFPTSVLLSAYSTSILTPLALRPWPLLA